MAALAILAITFAGSRAFAENTNYPGTTPTYSTGFQSTAISLSPVISSNMPVPYARAWSNGISAASVSNINFWFPLGSSAHGYSTMVNMWTTNPTTGGTADVVKLGIDYSNDGVNVTTNVANSAMTTLTFTLLGGTVSNQQWTSEQLTASSTVDNYRWARLSWVSNGSVTNTLFFGTPPLTNGVANWGTNWQTNGIIFSHWN